MTSKKYISLSLGSKKKNKDNAVLLDNRFPIAAIGASAGGLKAFEQFFTHLTKTGMAYVVITHLDRDHHSMLPDLIKRYTPLSVVPIINKTVIKPDTIYVIPVRKNVLIQDGVLHLVEQEEPHYTNLPINSFFSSLAADRGENAIAIILSGSGSDGALGLQDIKNNGGLTISQEPKTADYDGMPRSAINTGLVDYVLPPEEMPLQLVRYMSYGRIKDEKLSEELQQIYALLRIHTGHDFNLYKLNTVMRRIEKQMHAHQIKKLGDYVRFLKVNTHEVDNLFKDLLIGVTSFFRDPEAFETLKNKVLIPFFKTKPQDYIFRVWVPACASGEEAYSIAMILYESSIETKKYSTIQIFATDIDVKALEVARAGVYPATIENDVSSDRLKRFFTKDKKSYKVKKIIRSMVIFGEQNLIKDPPFTRLDLISCRNLLIYLNVQLQRKILPILHYSLKSKGVLFLGTSEATSNFADHFKLIAKKWKIFERKDVTTEPRAIVDFSALSIAHDMPTLRAIEHKSDENESDISQSIKNILLKDYLPPCIVVDKKGYVLFANDSIDSYLRSKTNVEKINISDHFNQDIKTVLIPVLLRVEAQKKEFICENVIIKKNKQKAIIKLRVIPIKNVAILRDLILVIFEEVKAANSDKLPDSLLKAPKGKYSEVFQELQYTKENLQATIVQLESGNEELQSTNEELQSTNEEIETSREELQSLNEELIIVNTELQNMIDQLAIVNDDMTNLFNSTEIAALFIDNNLNIKRFTPKSQKFFHLMQTDIGRPIAHFTTTIRYSQLVQDAEEVINTLHQKFVEVQDESGSWYDIRIIPYRTVSNMIDGVVITITNISRFKEYENELNFLNEQLKVSLSYAENIINTVHEPLVVMNADFKILSANKSFYSFFETNASESVGKYIYEIKNAQFDIPEFKQLLDKLVSKDIVLENFKLNVITSENKKSSLLLNARKVCNQIKGDVDIVILLAMELAR